MNLIEPIQQKDTVMQIQNNLLGKMLAERQTKWMQPTLMVLALLVAVLSATGCNPHH